MSKVFLALTLLLAVCAVSCSKEESLENGNGGTGGGNTNGVLLSQIVIHLGADSATTSFLYDGNKRLLTETNEGLLSIVSDDYLQRVTRSAQGVIQRVVVYDNSTLTDSIEYFVRYNSSNSRYIAKLTYDDAGNSVDSIAYNYDNSGKIVSQIAYVNFGSGFEPITKDTMIYDGGGNIKRTVTYERDGNVWDDIGEMAVDYDIKVNPLKLSQEAVVLDRAQYHGNNNPTKITIMDYDEPMFNQEITITYTYNSADRPVTANISIPGAGGASLPATFKYQ